MRARLVVRITPADVGRRVSLRSRLHGAAPSATDTVGYLRSWVDDELLVERKDGATVRIHAADLIAGKVVPDQPPQRRGR
ncbi:MAG: hypothetical protein GEU74_08935 [Nitriliruptorales bacterium]|nr:hypothetical protein [Nitriliruptorales bacterium]